MCYSFYAISNFRINFLRNYLIENTFDRKRIYANPSSCPYPNSNAKPNTNPNSNPNPNPKAQLCFRTDEMTSFFHQVYRYRKYLICVY